MSQSTSTNNPTANDSELCPSNVEDKISSPLDPVVVDTVDAAIDTAWSDTRASSTDADKAIDDDTLSPSIPDDTVTPETRNIAIAVTSSPAKDESAIQSTPSSEEQETTMLQQDNGIQGIIQVDELNATESSNATNEKENYNSINNIAREEGENNGTEKVLADAIAPVGSEEQAEQEIVIPPTLETPVVVPVEGPIPAETTIETLDTNSATEPALQTTASFTSTQMCEALQDENTEEKVIANDAKAENGASVVQTGNDIHTEDGGEIPPISTTAFSTETQNKASNIESSTLTSLIDNGSFGKAPLLSTLEQNQQQDPQEPSNIGDVALSSNAVTLPQAPLAQEEQLNSVKRQSLSPASITKSASKSNTEFINKGLEEWERNRRKWLSKVETDATSTVASVTASSSSSSLSTQAQQQQQSHAKYRHAVPLNVDDIIDVIFAAPQPPPPTNNRGNQPIANGFSTIPKFPRPVPLPQMVDILQDLWEAEGLDV